jgi:Domain of unknown function (DUF5668)
MDKQEKAEKARRQKLVSNLVFGVLFLTLGVMFTLDNLGVFDVGRLRNYWPLILVAMGIPALVAPKDSGDQVWGVLLVAAGGFLQLRRLDLIDWTWYEIWPLFLILAGVVLLLRSALDRKQPRNGGVGSLENGGAR